MNVDLTKTIDKNDVIAVAVSGGSDSMALLHYMFNNAKKYSYTVITINVEHGIRENASISDTEFVKEYCAKNGIPILTYSVDCKEKAKTDKLSVEEAGRILRYDCFYDAISSGKCTKVATAHHVSDNVESVLLNLFRGTGLKGLTGINENFLGKIIRPFLTVTKQEILDYILENKIPYVTDESNLCTDYTRNFLRNVVVPKIKEVFPEFEKSVTRLSSILKDEDNYLDTVAKRVVTLCDSYAQIQLPCDNAILKRACIISLKHLGIEKDWEKTHVDSVQNLINLENGCKIDLPKGVVAIKEYDKIVIYKNVENQNVQLPFNIGEFNFLDKTIKIKQVENSVNLKDGFYIDKNLVPKTAVIRQKRDGDVFTKFGGGTKKLNDYFTDKKIPKRLRSSIPILVNDNEVYAVFGVAVSEKVKVTPNTTDILQLDIY